MEKSELSLLFKDIQEKIKKENNFEQGKALLLEFRKEMENIFLYLFNETKDFSYSPIKDLKTVGYYIYHLTRIEDINCHTLMLNDEQIFFKNDYQKKLEINIITTGNELEKPEIIAFSQMLNIYELKNYFQDVFYTTNQAIKKMTFSDSKTKISEEKRKNLENLKCVSTDEKAIWLIDYWCKKTYGGLLLMPFSRHHFMHLYNALSINKKSSLKK